ncbi:HNH endonuclease [Demequina sp. TTPB684]|uniref:HNH endonuclease signature motif containing protein n=1 Tax=unclassified Demequina TaxID=2620311 RepID=UPI001CF30EFB|nr:MULTISPECIES: HNH endonuclease signature motif containing protein [unclassified Demequina]MCB2412153.1 HNH endonuclease [Demequina sp. TTPB684]UPU88586.1 HNH endonuclease [Demequina sp. TMPB413]
MTDQLAVAGTAQIENVGALTGELVRRDIGGLSHEGLLAEYDAVSKLGRLADALEARYAGEIARRSAPDLPGGGLARRQGFGNAGDMVAAVTGSTQAGAWRSIEVGQALMPEPALPQDHLEQADDGDRLQHPPAPRYPAIAEASVSGSLSRDAAAIITSGLASIADRVPSEQLHVLEKQLVAKAVDLRVKDVRRLVGHAVARADLPGHIGREKRNYDERYLTWTEDHTGMVTLSGRMDVVTAAPIRTVIEQIVTQQFRRRRDQDPTDKDQRTAGQMRADALRDLARHALGCKETTSSGIRTTLVVRMNLADFNSGEGLGSIDGIARPVSVGELRRLAGEAGIIPQVLGGPGEVLDQGREVRMFTRAQRLALLERDGGCAKCHAPPEHCEAHHIDWWEHGGRSDLNNGVMLCTRCHHDIHRQGWGIRIRDGQVHFIPPPDIEPAQTPRLGGRAALEIGGVRSVGGISSIRRASSSRQDTGENSALDAA